MHTNTKTWGIALLGAAAGIGAVWFIHKQKARRPSWLTSWHRTLIKQRGDGEAQEITAATWQKCAALLVEREMPSHPALRWHLKEHILPGYALYQVLLEENGGNKLATLAEIDEIFRCWTLERVQKQFGKMLALPIPFRLFKLAASLQLKAFPWEGWEITYIENSNTRLAFNMTRCFYLDTLTALGAPELTTSFCKNDDVMAKMFSSSAQFVRPHTLGRGDALCDFQYCRIERSRPQSEISG